MEKMTRREQVIYDYVIRYRAKMHFSPSMREIADTLLPNSNTNTGATVTANYGGVSQNRVNYWLEVVPGQPGTTVRFNGVDYVFAVSEEHSQLIDLQGSLTAKVIAGFNNVGEINGAEGNIYTYNFYYTRNQYTLSFDTLMSGLTISPIANIPHGTPLLGYKPADPVVAGKAFLGWYYEAECKTAVDWNNDTMPVGNLKLFAKWESDALTANFYFDDTLDELLHHAGVEFGGTDRKSVV